MNLRKAKLGIAAVLGCCALCFLSRAIKLDLAEYPRPAAEAFPTALPSSAQLSAQDPQAAPRREGHSATKGKGLSDRNGAPDLSQVRKRSWPSSFLAELGPALTGQSIEFELTDGKVASGIIHRAEKRHGELAFVGGELLRPERGHFFFQKQSTDGIAGPLVGVVELSGSKIGYRLEPTGTGNGIELVEHPLSEVLCDRFPRPVQSKETRQVKASNHVIGQMSQVPIPAYQQGIIVLNSLRNPGPVVYLDFAGGSTPTWGGITYAKPNVSNDQIVEVWSRVAEDFLPFNIDVTTDLQVYQNAPDGGRQRVIITPTDTASPEAGGAAYTGSFNWSGETPCWVFIISGKDCAEACSHEIGHTLGLNHDGQLIEGVNYTYFAGQGGGETGWAPIMGLGYAQNITQWSQGEYFDANNKNDQLQTISTWNNGVSFRADDTGDTLATSRYLELYKDDTASAEGIIESTGDTDAFQFTTEGGLISLRADPAPAGPNLAIQATLCDASDTILATSNPQNTLWAELVTNLPGGTYTFRVSGAGRNDPLTNGFSNYASLGYYSITGSVANARLPDRFAIAEQAPVGTYVGTVSVRNPRNDPVTFAISGGNSGDVFSIDAAGALTVADSSALDYNTLAIHTQFDVQLELLVTITDLLDASLTETSHRVVVAVLPTPPLITSQPQDITAPAGSTIALSASVQSSASPRFQWFFNGQMIVGGDSATLVLTNIQSADAGQYQVQVVNWFSINTSRVAMVSVTPAAPAVAEQPQSHGTFPGFNVELDCQGVGSEPLNYQWQLNGVDIPGATQAALDLMNISATQTGLYHAVISNVVGSVVSSDALVTMVPVAAWGSDSSGQTELPLELTNAVEVAAGTDFSVALKGDGTVFVWGATNRVPNGLSGIVSIAAGANHIVALKSDGSLTAWGDNTFGQLRMPTGVGSFVAIAAGANHSLALQSSGQVYAWGSATSGQTKLPGGLTSVVAIAAGTNHSLALRSDGVVVAWGDNSYGQTNIPAGLTNVIAIAAGANHNLALRQNGTVVAWGNNAFGQTLVPTLLSNVVAVAAGAFNCLAIKSDGTLVGWGAGVANGPAGLPNTGQTSPPPTATNVTQVSCGPFHTLGLVGEGAPFLTVQPVGRFSGAGLPAVFRAVATGAFPMSYQWQFMGTNIPGATNQLLILPPVTDQNVGWYSVTVSNTYGVATSSSAQLTVTEFPFLIQQPQSQNIWVGGSATLQVVAGGLPPLNYQWWFSGEKIDGATNSALTLEGIDFAKQGDYSVVVSNKTGVISSQKARLSVSQVAAWGVGQFNGQNANDYGQTLVPNALTGVVQVAAGGYHSLALKDDGTVVAWGAGNGVEGLGAIQNYGQCSVPAGLTHVVAIAAGGYHSLALTDQGKVIAWGAGTTNLNRYPHFGQSLVPPSLSGVIAIAAGQYHSVALRQDGRVIVWGYSSQNSATNVPIAAVNVVRIASHGGNIAALTANGGLVEWGATPTINLEANGTAIAAADFFSLVMKPDGTLSSWGTIYLIPGTSNLVQIAAGDNHALAVKADRTVMAWGQTNVYSLGAIPKGLSNVVDIAGGQYHSLAVVGSRSVLIKAQPTDRIATTGQQTAFTVDAAGILPIKYQWLFNGTKLFGATSAWLRLNSLQTAQAGAYQVIVSNSFGTVTSRVANLTVVLPVGPALNAANLSWATLGDGLWFGESGVTHDRSQAAQSGAIGDNQQCSIQTKITGPGKVDFWWKVSSEQWFDYLNLYVDNVKITGISGEVDWQEQSIAIGAGTHTLTWNYEKDASGSEGLDAGWVDQVLFSPTPPVITGQPVSQTLMAGGTVSLNVTTPDPGPINYQWFKDGVPIPGPQFDHYEIANATRNNSGKYAVQVSNTATSIMSSVAVVKVVSPQELGQAIWMTDGTFRIVSSDTQGVAILLGELPNFQAQVSSNLLDWVPLNELLWFDNGNPIIVDHSATNYSQRFYRIVEHAP
jgi:alpha-tubulin suppressor-like RCC1 family protein